MERIKALFVDDQVTLRDQYAENIKIALSECGVDLDVVTTEQVEDAKRILKPGDHDFRLVVTDVLYGGIDGGGASDLKPRGLEVVTQAAKTPGVAIVAISVGSNTIPRLENLAKNAGAHVFRFRQDVQSTASAWDELAAEIRSALINVGAIRAAGAHPVSNRQATATRDARMPTFRTLSILFMDLSGWSKLEPEQIYAYLSTTLPKLADIVAKHERVHQNTWGDALVATFDSTAKAAQCALDLRDFFRRTTGAEGVPAGLIPRIALHVGEVIIAPNPLLGGAEDVFGDAVHRAARLEPKTEVGAVFCTEAFAKALYEVRGCAAKACLFCEIELPKGFGKERAHMVIGPGETIPQVSGAQSKARK